MAHNFELSEPIIKALQAQLQTQLPTAVATVNADVTDGFTITAPTRVFDHMPMISTIAGAGFPAVAIQDGTISIQNDLVSSVESSPHITVVVFVANPDPEALAWQLRRYQQAIALAIQFDRTLGSQNTTWTTLFNGFEPGPYLEPTDKPNAAKTILSWFAVDLEMRRTEV